MNAIKINKVTKLYPDSGKNAVRALHNLSLEIEEGEIFGYLGPNGAGKSTTMKILIGLIRSTEGSVELAGKPAEEARFHTRIGYIPEEHNYYPHLKVKQFLSYMAALGTSPMPPNERVDAAMEMLTLEKAMRKRMGDLSLGWRQRVALAAAFIDDPEILILDEPTNGLDPIAVAHFVGLMKEMRDKGKTILFSSHQLAEVEKSADRIGILREGELVTVGKLDDLLQRDDGINLHDLFLETVEAAV